MYVGECAEIGKSGKSVESAKNAVLQILENISWSILGL